jgi:hypothetical protein
LLIHTEIQGTWFFSTKFKIILRQLPKRSFWDVIYPNL